MSTMEQRSWRRYVIVSKIDLIAVESLPPLDDDLDNLIGNKRRNTDRRIQVTMKR